MFHDPDFTPFQPRSKPSFRANLRNYLENLPPAAYRQGFVALPGLPPLVPKTILLTDPECIEEMLVARAELFPRDKMTARSISEAVNRESLFFAEGANWKWQRRAAAPAFRHDTTCWRWFPLSRNAQGRKPPRGAALPTPHQSTRWTRCRAPLSR